MIKLDHLITSAQSFAPFTTGKIHAFVNNIFFMDGGVKPGWDLLGSQAGEPSLEVAWAPLRRGSTGRGLILRLTENLNTASTASGAQEARQ